MHIKSQDGKSLVRYSEASITSDLVHVHGLENGEKIYLGNYVDFEEPGRKTKKVISMIQSAAEEGVETFEMPQTNEV